MSSVVVAYGINLCCSVVGALHGAEIQDRGIWHDMFNSVVICDCIVCHVQ